LQRRPRNSNKNSKDNNCFHIARVIFQCLHITLRNMIAFLKAATSLPGLSRAERKRESTINFPIHLDIIFFFVAGSLEPYEIQFAPRHSRVSFLDPRYASTFHWHASCHLLLQRATLSASRRFGAMRCSVEQRRDATRHVASCHTAARHADRWYSRCDARPLYFRPALESASNSIIRVPKRPP